MSQISIAALFCRGIRRVKDDHGIVRFSLDHLMPMHSTVIKVPHGIEKFLVPIGPLYAYIFGSKAPQANGAVGGDFEISLAIDGLVFFRMKDKPDFRLSDKTPCLVHAIDLGNVDVPWTSNLTTDTKKLELQFSNADGQLIGAAKMLLEVEVIRA